MNDVITTHNDAITTIRLNRAAKKNALTREMYQQMADALLDANADKNCKLVVIKATGDTFCAGNEISGFAEQGTDPHLSETVNFMKALLHCNKVVVAEVAGLAIGIGTTMLLHCDLVYCASNTRFMLPFINLGLVPEYASSYLLPLIAGRRKASEWLLLGDPFDAEQAYAFGLVNRVVAPQDLSNEVDKVVQQLAQKPSYALLQSKALLNHDTDNIEQHIDRELDVFLEALTTEAAQEAFAAFLQKRPINPEKFK